MLEKLLKCSDCLSMEQRSIFIHLIVENNIWYKNHGDVWLLCC
ncbi:hypothetical protein BLAHAN_04284 [Blautia hansenii DSM 20583]|uniref:Uncharacterized protein n=1 Tax=Blautia hansenii DSM 20583 TaxID=537007 RepID=C9L4I7_BLAHA|nr:hypothetical protein BLAHAN_04284 [Blautia hansenii DSM 20583]